MNHAKKMFSMYLMAQAVCATLAAGAVPYDYTFPYTSNANTVALYHFNEGSGTASADASSNGNTLTVPSTTWKSPEDAKFGNSAFESYGTALSAADSASFDSLNNALTLETWLYIPEDTTMTTSQYRGIITKMNWGTNDGFFLALRGTGYAISESVAFRFQIGGGVLATTVSTGLPIGEWFHIAAVLDTDGSMRLYMNGNMIGEYLGSPRNVTDNNVDLRLNYLNGAGQKFFNIIYDETRISNIAMTPSHVTLNVLDYDVEGDGTTDDSVAFQNAIDAAVAQEATLQIPANCTIRITKNLFLYGQCNIEGAGDTSIILCDADLANDYGRQYWISVGITDHKDNSGVQDCYTGTISNLCIKASSNAKFSRCIYIFNGSGVTISDVLFDFEDGVHESGACLFGATESGNDSGWAPSGVQTKEQIVLLCNTVSANHGYGDSEGLGLSLVDGVVIYGNYIYGIGDDPIACHTCENIVIKNNECYSLDGRILLTCCTQALVEGNYCTRIPDFNSTWYGGGAVIYVGLEGSGEKPASNNIEIKNNTIEIPSQIPSWVYGIRIRGARDVTVSGNDLVMDSANGGGGIRVEADTSYPYWVDPDDIDTDGIARPRDIAIKENICQGTYPGMIGQTGLASTLPGPYNVGESATVGNTAGSYMWYTNSSVWSSNILTDEDYSDFYVGFGMIEDPTNIYVDSNLTNVRPAIWTTGYEYTAAKNGRVLGYNIQLSQTITAGFINLYFYKNGNLVCSKTATVNGDISLSSEITTSGYQAGDKLLLKAIGSSTLLPNNGINITATVYAVEPPAE